MWVCLGSECSGWVDNPAFSHKSSAVDEEEGICSRSGSNSNNSRQCGSSSIGGGTWASRSSSAAPDDLVEGQADVQQADVVQRNVQRLQAGSSAGGHEMRSNSRTWLATQQASKACARSNYSAAKRAASTTSRHGSSKQPARAAARAAGHKVTAAAHHERADVHNTLPLLLQRTAVALPRLPQRHRRQHHKAERHVACGSRVAGLTTSGEEHRNVHGSGGGHMHRGSSAVAGITRPPLT